VPDHEVYRLNMTASYNVLEAAEINGIEKICMASSVNALGNKPGLARGVHALRAGAMALKDSYTAYPNTADSLLSHKSLMALARGPLHPHAGADWGDKIAPEYFPIDEAHPTRNQDVYSMTKYLGEQLADSYARRRPVQISSMRFHWLLRPEDAAGVSWREGEGNIGGDKGFFAWTGR
jgi:UDP-glucose 4-epimerase